MLREAVLDERVKCSCLHIPLGLRLSRDANRAGVGLGAIDQATSAEVDDLSSSVIRGVSPRIGIFSFRTVRDPLCRGGGIRAHPQRRKLFTRFQVLLPMHSRGCRFVALEYRVFNWRCLAAELFALARSCKRNRNACLLAASDDMALISMENGLNRLKASFSFQFLPVCRPFGN